MDLLGRGTSGGLGLRELGAKQLNLGGVGGAHAVPGGAGKTLAVIFDEAGGAVLILGAAFQAVARYRRGGGDLIQLRNRVHALVVKAARNMLAYPIRHGVVWEFQLVDELPRAARGGRNGGELRDGAVLQAGAHVAGIDPSVDGVAGSFGHEQGGGKTVEEFLNHRLPVRLLRADIDEFTSEGELGFGIAGIPS